MLAGLLNDFREQPNGGAWALFHMDHHRAIAAAIQKQFKVNVDLFPLDQMPLENMSQWLRAHQRMHDSFSSYINVSANNLSDLDLHNEFSVKLWLQQNFSEHQAAEQLLGIQG
jgi:hypothetical protein